MGLKEELVAIRARHETSEATYGDVEYLLAAIEQALEEFAIWNERLASAESVARAAVAAAVSRCEECGASLAHVADSRGLAGVLCPNCDRDSDLLEET